VVEGARLESVYTGNRIVGSNPTLTASLPRPGKIFAAAFHAGFQYVLQSIPAAGCRLFGPAGRGYKRRAHGRGEEIALIQAQESAIDSQARDFPTATETSLFLQWRCDAAPDELTSIESRGVVSVALFDCCG
jgi:hypothetical protein